METYRLHLQGERIREISNQQRESSKQNTLMMVNDFGLLDQITRHHIPDDCNLMIFTIYGLHHRVMKSKSMIWALNLELRHSY
jgi:hypothetical protein